MTNQASDPSTRETSNRLHSVAIHLLRGLQAEDAASGLTRARLSALSVLVFAGPLRVSRLAEIEGVRPPTMTGLVRGLEQQGLVRRRPDPSDARACLVFASDDGWRILEEARSRRLGSIERKVGALSPADQKLIGKAARILARIFVPDGLPPLPPDESSKRRPLLRVTHQERPSASVRNRMKDAPDEQSAAKASIKPGRRTSASERGRETT